MNEGHIKQLYKLLKHEGYYSRIGSLDYKTKKYEDKLLQGIEEILDYARKWNGIRNLFISRNPRKGNGSILGSFCISLDIDPVRGAGLAATDEQHEMALDAGRFILERHPGGILASSGNGCLLLYPVENGIPDLEDYYRKEKLFIQELNELVKGENLNAKIDNTSYEEAVIKLIGTQSTKGDERYHRLSRFITSTKSVEAKKLYFFISNLSIPEKQLRRDDEFRGNPVERIKEAQEALKNLPLKFQDDYEMWLKVGMALKEFGISGLQLWKEWSKQGEKYEEGICEKKWDTFKESPEITLGSLKYWAEGSRKLSATSKPTSLSHSDYFSRLFSEDSDTEKPILTGIGSLDSVLRGLPKGEITTIAARSGFGKSSFCVSVVEYLRKQKRKCLYFSTEMSAQYILHKFVSIATGIPTQKLIEHSLDEEATNRIRNYEQELLQSPLIICDEFSPTIELVKDQIEQHKPDVVVFDHATQSGVHWEYVAQFVRGLKEITAQKNIVTLLASQLNEPPRGSNGAVGVSVRGDVRGSQEVIFLSAIFMMMNNLYEVKTNFQPVELEIAKNRFGVSGIKLEIHANKETGLYTD